MSFQVFGKVIIVLNTAEVARELLEERSAIYSDRPVLPIYEMCVHELYTHDFNSVHNNQDGMAVVPGRIKEQQLLACRTQDD